MADQEVNRKWESSDRAWREFLLMLIGPRHHHKSSLNYAIGQLADILLPHYFRQVPSVSEERKSIGFVNSTVSGYFCLFCPKFWEGGRDL